MHFDDRLATVLRHRAAGERAARTQFRQLLDLLGSRRHGRDESLLAAAWLRLAALGEALPSGERAAMIREPGLRFRNPELALHLAEDEPEVAAAALGVAQLTVEDWDALIPRLPIRARGFLRLRRDLPRPTQDLLERLGIRDRGLPRPDSEFASEEETLELAVEATPIPLSLRPIPANDLADDAPATAPAPAVAADDSEIGALVKRIEAYRKTRASRMAGEDDPRLPLGERAETTLSSAVTGFAFTTDGEGRIDWAEPRVAPMVVGALLAPATGRSQRLQPIVSQATELAGAPAIAGDWVVDAAPRFSEAGGRFLGYAGRFRRPAPPEFAVPPVDPAADRMRQLLHELKTPVNAIQGFAEVIQQQLFGPAPHEYRALAAAIAGDAARILAGFDELDRLAKLETGALVPQSGDADWSAIVSGLAGQLDEVLRPRGARFELAAAPGRMPVPLDANEAATLGWRLLATLTGAAGANEVIALTLEPAPAGIRLAVRLPGALAGADDVFAADGRAGGGAVSAGMFGAGFALRLARAEARAIGGDLTREGDTLVLVLPRLTAASRETSPVAADAAHG
ncbi:sensory histidine kinase CreC [Tsuneonella dongtanensis]|uniref:histidine kinase n=1 Tax=Tsuneonella dongtanensis TaxID=692370 RepID=A0A1B2AGC0_9SPHN|nr:histidine kinase dimerization/phospho-acceptor domain-containing protein [Tsuneonella dongtanensis]ANY21194.1 sensory histidine kinase CreC [Tsuneonella dongtanensis]